MELANKVALVTGSSRGIGRAIAFAMAEAGANVAVHYATQRELAEQLATEIVALGRRALVVGGDVASRAALEQMVVKVEAELGPIDILVNNAAAFLENVPLWDITEAQWDRVFAVNVKGPLFAIQLVLPSMKRRKTGAIINISTLGADVVMGGFGAYISSKGALNTMTRAAALELAPWNIRVNAISPGHIDTLENIEWITSDPGREIRFRARIALGRLGKREEIGRTAVFLASEGAGYITGQVLHLDGGIMIWQGPIV
jgi:NAD(P)-dependent dehydrogenase (short-subunit alcohol dehydrogenase family)